MTVTDMSHQMQSVALLLSDKGLTVEPGDTGTYFDIHIGPALVTVLERPPYCDRGRFQVQVDTTDILALDLDHADGFPRYYFDPAACALEVILWLGARGLHS